MDNLLCIIGGKEIYLVVSDKLSKLLFETQRTIDYCKHLERRKRIRDNSNIFINIDPSFIFAFEEKLTAIEPPIIFSTLVSSFSKSEQSVLLLLLREGKTFRFFKETKGYEPEKIETLIRLFFIKLSEKLNKEKL